MPERTLIVEEPAPGVVLVRLNRPDRLNALSADLMAALEELWTRLRRGSGVRCVVLTGNGRGFCSGADAGFLAADRAPRGAGLDGELSFVPGRILDVPVVVAVNGVCAGGGLHFVADADIVIAAETATFLDPHVSVGQVSGIEPPSLALRLPLPVISRMALMGRDERLTARRLYELGLVTELVDEAGLVDRAVEIARVVASASPAAVRATRRSWRRLSDGLVEPAMREGWDDVQKHWPHPDAAEGPAALRDKRPPVWTD
ncbi:enoyl-CoA hydratase/isomerase family protein [Phytohabitans houttuyneae]|uniref:Crotonase n=1 Tax=Phytohabitans houttuyneae TaxID=1076126 RepID=A0A6V8KAV1_9ACTN|nr:enoyl-CoA hydratase/isomerase family protein [Phytohabitans houttuyneae]GFJ82362.1 crotonase [Phytohabitans houttuyneae]